MSETKDLWECLKQQVRPLHHAGAKPQHGYPILNVQPHYSLPRQLDLHGLTLQEAFIKVKAFIRSHFENQTKTIHIICGKGRGNSGLIKNEIGFWLEQENDKITSFTWQNDGGAVRICLRKKK